MDHPISSPLWNVIKAIGICFLAFFLAAVAFALFAAPAIVPAPLVVLVVVLIIWAVIRYRKRWWRAWDEKGRPIDVEVLPDAKVTRR
jgi:hypothetical protein